jgi:hypothetical protein
MNLFTSLIRRFSQATCGLLLIGLIWHSNATGATAANISANTNTIFPAPIAISNSGILKQVANKTDSAKDQARSAIKDGKKAANKNIKKMKKSTKNTTKSAKNFLGM